MFALFLEFRARTGPRIPSDPPDLWPFFISATGLKFLIWTQSEIGPRKLAGPFNRAHLKRPSVLAKSF